MIKNRNSSSHRSREHGYALPYKLACEQLTKISDIEEQCRKSGARYIPPNEVLINYLNQIYHITLPGGEILLEDSNVEVPLKDKILILHYFNSAKGTPATGVLVTYKQLSGGVSYFPAFSQRAIAPFVNHFGKNPELLTKVAAKLGGFESDQGDVSVTINAFDYVPITLVLWRGDEEFDPSGNILFDASISDYLTTEDVAVLTETITWKLVKGIPSA